MRRGSFDGGRKCHFFSLDPRIIAQAARSAIPRRGVFPGIFQSLDEVYPNPNKFSFREVDYPCVFRYLCEPLSLRSKLNSEPKKPKAIALLSGGLDSLLAAKIVQDEGVEVVGLHLVSPFGCQEDVEKRAAAIGVPLRIRDKGDAYLDLVKKPQHGYGRAMNPCIDCRIYMFDIAEQVMKEENADFIVTGEVLGQRPMSQIRSSLELIDRKSAMEDRILRPLSAKAFEPTLPEREGWVNREKLFDIRGRARTEQMALVKKLEVKEYGSPGGGCLLTLENFAPRVRDFFEHEHFKNEAERRAQSELLRFGRHFRLHDGAKVIVARNGDENPVLENAWEKAGGAFLFPNGFQGPLAILLGATGELEKKSAGALIARYGKPKTDSEIRFSQLDEQGNRIEGKFPTPAPALEERMEEIRL